MITYIYIYMCVFIKLDPATQSDNWYQDRIEASHKSHSALDNYATMHRFLTKMCTHVHIYVSNMVYSGIWDWYNQKFVQQAYLLHWIPGRLTRFKYQDIKHTLWSFRMAAILEMTFFKHMKVPKFRFQFHLMLFPR